VFIEKIQYTSFFIAVMIIMGILAMLYMVYMKNQFASRKIESRLGHDKTT
ncbi:MFS transporter, partial [Bacillus sp. HC-TM]